MTNHVCIHACIAMVFILKVVLKGFACDQFVPRLIRLVVSIIWTKAKLLSMLGL